MSTTGALVLGFAVLAALAWLAFLIRRSRVRRKREAAPLNRSFFMDDATLETKRLNSILGSALVATAVLALLIPWYYLSETSRQAHAEERFEEIAIERGHEWYEEFQCGDCHGPSGGGGGADYVEARSGLTTSWAAPSVNDVFLRYDEEEVRYWLVYGRAGSPMPAWGAEGGGPLNTQQIDELLAYLEYIAEPQPLGSAAVDRATSRANLELSRLDGADATVADLLERQRAEIRSLEEAPAQLDAIGDSPARLEALFTDDGTCTPESAELYRKPCDRPGPDSDGDGLTDAAEAGLAGLIDEVVANAPAGDPVLVLERMEFDPADRFTTEAGDAPIPDLDQAVDAIGEIDTIVRNLQLAVDNLDVLMADAVTGLSFLESAAVERRWAFDVPALAEAFGGDAGRTQRAIGLFNAQCARCHTAGYSAGVAFTQEAGSGGFGPSLRGGRSVTQFPDFDDQVGFVIEGSENGKQYGVNGVGRGWMPGFGTILGRADLELIVTLVRALP
jgi:mono/diheme cytochrome c family protein